MRRYVFLILALVPLCMPGITPAETCIDSTTDETSRDSWDKMLTESSEEKRQQLQNALGHLIVAELKTQHVTSSLLYHTALSDPSPVLVKRELSGLCADQVIALAHRLARDE